jgi:hypothetical protein
MIAFLHVVVANDANVVSEAVADSAAMGASQLVPQTRVLLASTTAMHDGAMKHVALEGDRFFCFFREDSFTFACVVNAPGLDSQRLAQLRVSEFLQAVRNTFVLSRTQDATNKNDDDDDDELLLGGIQSPFAMSDSPLDEQLRRLLRDWNSPQQQQQQQQQVQQQSQQQHHVVQMPEGGGMAESATLQRSFLATGGDQYRAYSVEVQQKEYQRKVKVIAAASCIGAVVLFLFLL